MCFDPATAAIIGTIATVAGTGMQVFGSIQQGQAAQAASDYNAAVARNNAIAAEQQAATDEEQQRDRFRRAQAAARASLGLSGTTGAGSAEDLLAENAANAELDAQAIRYRGRVTADNYRSQADMTQFEGGQRATASYIGAGTNLLLAAGQWATNRSQGRPLGYRGT